MEWRWMLLNEVACNFFPPTQSNLFILYGLQKIN